MKVRAIAAASAESNAVGTVELECTPHGLAIVYLGVGSFATGFAVAALTHGTSVCVPWSSVLDARAEGDRLYLAVEPALTPHNRLHLASFKTGDLIHERELLRQRLILRAGTVGAALVGMLAAGVTVPLVAPEATAAAALAVAVLTAVVILGLGFLAHRAWSPTVDPDTARNALIADLSQYLPRLVVGPARPRRPAPPISLPTLQGFLPRTTLAIAVTLAAGVLGAVLVGRWVISGGAAARYGERGESMAAAGRPPPTSEVAVAAAPPRSPAPVAEISSARAAPAEPPAQDRARTSCRCDRSDSTLWRNPIPRLSTLLLSQRPIQERDESKLEVTVAAVNNGSEDILDLAMMVQFFDQDPPPSSKRYPVSNRALFYEGPLGPGQAIKWTVEAEGTSFELHSPIEGTIGPAGEGAAPTNLLAELLKANHRPVRLHGARMLAYLGDPRAREAAVTLGEALREDEAPYLRRLLQATGEVRVCQVQVSRSAPRRLDACIFNGSRDQASDLGFLVRALASPVDPTQPTGAPPTVLASRKWRVPEALPPDTGTRVSTTWEAPETSSAEQFELYVDRFDLLD